MNRPDLLDFIERFREQNRDYDIGLHFIMRGLHNLLEAIAQLELDEPNTSSMNTHLNEAIKLLHFGQTKVTQDQEGESRLHVFIRRHLALARKIQEEVASEPDDSTRV